MLRRDSGSPSHIFRKLHLGYVVCALCLFDIKYSAARFGRGRRRQRCEPCLLAAPRGRSEEMLPPSPPSPRHRTLFALARECASAPQALRKAGAHIQHVASNTQRAKWTCACVRVCVWAGGRAGEPMKPPLKPSADAILHTHTEQMYTRERFEMRPLRHRAPPYDHIYTMCA